MKKRMNTSKKNIQPIVGASLAYQKWLNCTKELLGRRHNDQICRVICTWKWSNSFQGHPFDWQVSLFLLLRLCWLHYFNDDPPFVSKLSRNRRLCLFMLWSKACFLQWTKYHHDFLLTTGNKSLNSVLQLGPHEFNTPVQYAIC